jgi:hypothetical protein
MKHTAFGTLYILIGLTFLLITFVTVNETSLENEKSVDEFQIITNINLERHAVSRIAKVNQLNEKSKRR